MRKFGEVNIKMKEKSIIEVVKDAQENKKSKMNKKKMQYISN